MMKSKKIAAILLAGTMLLAGAFSGCSGSKTSSGGSSSDKVELTMIEALANPTRTAALKKIIADFEKDNPNYNITLVSPPTSTADEKISQMLMAKSKLDIVEVRAWTLRQFVNNKWIEPLDTYIKNWSDYQYLSDNSKYSMTVDGKQWGLPIGSYQRMIYYRSDWLKEAGLTIPTGDAWTFDALYDIAKKMTDASKGRYGWTLRGSGNSYQQFIYQVMFAALGSKGIAGNDDPFFTKDGKSVYRTAAAKKGFETQLKFYQDCSPKDSIAWGFTDQINAFTSNITCFLMQDSDCVGTFKEKMKDGTWATAPMPVDADTKQGTIGMGADLWGMTSYTANKDAAWKFLSYLDKPEVSAYFCKEYGVLPPCTNAYDIEPSFKSDIYAPYKYEFSKPDTYFGISDATQAYSSHDSEFGKTSDTDIQNVLAGKADMDQILSKWADLWDGWKASSASSSSTAG
jgi:multiple sugar transport system substrate-binding protein